MNNTAIVKTIYSQVKQALGSNFALTKIDFTDEGEGEIYSFNTISLPLNRDKETARDLVMSVKAKINPVLTKLGFIAEKRKDWKNNICHSYEFYNQTSDSYIIIASGWVENIALNSEEAGLTLNVFIHLIED